MVFLVGNLPIRHQKRLDTESEDDNTFKTGNFKRFLGRNPLSMARKLLYFCSALVGTKLLSPLDSILCLR